MPYDSSKIDRGIVMLTLTRKPDESITIITPDNHRIYLKVSQIRGNQVKVSFDAPAYYQIYRDEVLERIEQAC
jgi:carbon storage regulator CsrA